MESWQIGNSTVYRIEEQYGPLFDATTFFPDFDESVIQQHAHWMCPSYYDLSNHRLIASIHSFVIKTPHHTVLIDGCIGNDKSRMPYRDWHLMNTPYLSRLQTIGISPADVDFVMCTHLHVDHVGWNTRLENGQWVPTFPNAKYLFSKTEFEFWQAERNKNEGETFAAINNQTFDDSVLPIMHLAELIEGQHEVISDLLAIQPAPGHTPGSITISLSEGGEEALFSGDIMHHPIQIAETHWNSAYCELPEQAIATRRDVLSHCCNHGSLLMPAHFAYPFCGHIHQDDKGFRLSGP